MKRACSLSYSALPPIFTALICSSMWICSAVTAANDDDTLTPADIELFAWFDSLGYPDLAGREWVQVTRTISAEGFQPSMLPRQVLTGFLVDSNQENFTVFTLELKRNTFQRQQRDGFLRYAEFEPIVLAEYAENWLDIERSRKQAEVDRPMSTLGVIGELRDNRSELDESLREPGTPPIHSDPMENPVEVHALEFIELFVLARACAADGHLELSKGLLLAANEHKPRHYDPNLDVKEALGQDLAYRTIWRNVLAFDDLDISRPELLERFEHFIDRFPESRYLGLAQRMRDLLHRMVEEDRRHALSVKPFDEMTEQEQIAELIFQLRDQNGRQLTQPGRCDIFWDPRGPDSPAARLLTYGEAAERQLMDALDDDTLTRSIGFHRGFYFSHRVLTVGDCVEQILTALDRQLALEQLIPPQIHLDDPSPADLDH